MDRCVRTSFVKRLSFVARIVSATNLIPRYFFDRQTCSTAQNLEFYTDLGNMHFLVDLLRADGRTKRFAKLNEALVEIVEDFPFVGYHTLDIQNKESVIRLLRAIDKSSGYVYATMDANKLTFEPFIGKPENDPQWTMEVQERYMTN